MLLFANRRVLMLDPYLWLTTRFRPRSFSEFGLEGRLRVKSKRECRLVLPEAEGRFDGIRLWDGDGVGVGGEGLI